MSANPEFRVLLDCRMINDVVVTDDHVICFDLNCLKSDLDSMSVIPKIKPVKAGGAFKMKLVA